MEVINVCVTASFIRGDDKKGMSPKISIRSIIGSLLQDKVVQCRVVIGIKCVIAIIKSSNPFRRVAIEELVVIDYLIDDAALFAKGIFVNKSVSHVYSNAFMTLLVTNKLVHNTTLKIYTLEELKVLIDLLMVAFHSLILIDEDELKEFIPQLTNCWQLTIHLWSFTVFLLIIRSNLSNNNNHNTSNNNNNYNSDNTSNNSILINQIYQSTQFGETCSFFSPLSGSDNKEMFSSTGEEQFVINNTNEEAMKSASYLFQTFAKVIYHSQIVV